MDSKELLMPLKQDWRLIENSERSQAMDMISEAGEVIIIERKVLINEFLQQAATLRSQTEQGVEPEALVEKFFQPSNELAEAAYRYNEQLLLREDSMPSSSETEVDEEEDEDERLEEFSLGENRSFSPQEERRSIGERLYHYLRFLAKNPEESQETGNIEALSRAGSFLLGFSGYQESLLDQEDKRKMSLLIEQLISEFSSWLSSTCDSVYISPWGEIHLVDGKLVLSSHVLANEATDEPFTQANYITEFPKHRSARSGD